MSVMSETTRQMQTSEMKDYNATTLDTGDVFVSGSGVVIEVTHIRIASLNLSTPSIFVSYLYNDNGREGSETVSLTNFQNNIAS